MKCPFCTSLRNRVIDSRLSKDGVAIRRRRECIDCMRRFTTYERVEEVELLVVKKDGRREPFDRNKIITGMLKACEKRPISVKVIEKLYELDEVAYVRFSSVYRSFKDINQFMDELKDLLRDKEREAQKLTEKTGDETVYRPPLELIKDKSGE